jgi:hypothetical protein
MDNIEDKYRGYTYRGYRNSPTMSGEETSGNKNAKVEIVGRNTKRKGIRYPK